MTPRARAFLWAFAYLTLVGLSSRLDFSGGAVIPIGSMLLTLPSNVLFYALLSGVMDSDAKAGFFAAAMLAGATNAALVFAFFEWRRRRRAPAAPDSPAKSSIVFDEVD